MRSMRTGLVAIALVSASAKAGADAGAPDAGALNDAIAELRAVRDDPNADPLTARLAAREIVDTLARQGRIDDAAEEARAHANRLDPQFVRQTERLVRRRAMRRAALLELGVFAAAAGAALVRARLRGAAGQAVRAVRGLAPVALAFAAYVAGAGGLLASQYGKSYETGRATPFLLLGLAVLPLVLLARAWGAVGSTRAAARTGRAILGAASVLSTAFVVLEALDPAYLDGFGL